MLTGANDAFSGGTVGGSKFLYTEGTTAVSGLTIGGTVEWENTNAVNESGGSATIGDANGDEAILYNTPKATYDILDNSGIALGASTASYIDNAGLFEKTGGTGVSAVAPAVTNTGTIEVTAATLDLQGAVAGKGTDEISGASTLEFDSTVAAGQTLSFTGSGGTLDFTAPQGFAGKISGFDTVGANDAIEVAGPWAFSGFTENAGGTQGTLGFASGASHLSLTLLGDYAAADFVHQSLANGSTLINLHVRKARAHRPSAGCAILRAGKRSQGLSSPLTKSGSSDSLRFRRFGRVIGDGDGAVGGGSGRLNGDVGGDTTLAGTRVLRSAAGAAAGGRFRRVRGAGLPAVLRAEDGRAVATAGAVFSHAHDRLFRGDRQRARHCMALRGLFSLRDFLRLSNRDRVPDHSWLSRTRSRLPHEAHEKVFGWVLKLVAERGLVKGERIGVDGSTMEANAALRTIVRRDSGESYREMLTRMAKESGIATPSAEDLSRFDRKRKGKTLSNADWKSATDPEAKVARMKDGTTHLAYKPEHAVDLDTGVVVAAPIHAADEGDTTTLSPTLEVAARNLGEVGLPPSEDEPCVLVADKGYHARDQLKALDGGVWKTRIAEPEPANGYLRWHGDEAARKAVYANRARLKSGIGRETMRRRGELVERSFAHVLDRGGMRRAWLRGREKIHKRYLIHVAGFNLGVLMRALHGQGTPREAAEAAYAFIFALRTDAALAFGLIAVVDRQFAILVLIASAPPSS